MKALSWFLAVSLSANVVLLTVRWRASRSAALESGLPTSVSSPPLPSPAATLASNAVLPELTRIQWQDVEALLPDERDQLLNRSGFSIAEKKAVEAYLETVRLRAEGVLTGSLYDSSRTADLRENPEIAVLARHEFGDFPLETLQAAWRRRADYGEAEAKIYRQHGGRTQLLTKEDRAALADLEGAFQADLARIFTPDQWEQYQLQSSDTGKYLRDQLTTFRPTEDEYKALFRLYRAADEAVLTTGVTGTEADKMRRAAYDQLKPQIATLLEPARYADYLEVHERGSDKLNRLIARLDLPLATAGQVNAVREDLTQRAAVIRADAQLAPADREARLVALAQEARVKLSSTLGADGFEAYDAMKGEWIRALEAR
jgi:hypothetical protein